MLGKFRRPRGTATQQIDKGILEARRDRLKVRPRLAGERVNFSLRRRLAQHHAHRLALDDAIAHGLQGQRARKHLAPLHRGAAQQEAAARQSVRECVWGSAVGEPALVEQQDIGTAFGFIQVRGRPDHSDAVSRQ